MDGCGWEQSERWIRPVYRKEKNERQIKECLFDRCHVMQSICHSKWLLASKVKSFLNKYLNLRFAMPKN